GHGRALHVVARRSRGSRPAQRHLGVARGGGETGGRSGSDALGRGAHLRGVPALARGVHRGDHVIVGRSVGERSIGVARRGDGGGIDRRVRPAGDGGALHVVARRSRGSRPAQRHLGVARGGGETGGRSGSDALGRGAHLIRVPALARGVHRGDHVIVGRAVGEGSIGVARRGDGGGIDRRVRPAGDGGALHVVARRSRGSRPAQRHLGVARGGGETGGRSGSDALGRGAHLIRVPALPGGVHRADHVEVGRAIGEPGIGEGCPGGIADRGVRPAGRGRTLHVVARRSGRGGPAQR